MKWFVPVLLVALSLLIYVCCSASDVVVTDRAGVPVAGAMVESVTLSASYRPTVTDKKGGADLPWAVQEVKWLNVSAPGFETAHVDYTGGRPQRVILDR